MDALITIGAAISVLSILAAVLAHVINDIMNFIKDEKSEVRIEKYFIASFLFGAGLVLVGVGASIYFQ